MREKYEIRGLKKNKRKKGGVSDHVNHGWVQKNNIGPLQTTMFILWSNKSNMNILEAWIWSMLYVVDKMKFLFVSFG